MVEAAFWLAVACAVVGAFAGNRTAVVLLASVLLCIGLDQAEVAFNFLFWVLIDCVVILAIVRRGMTYADVAVIALFAPAWVFYLLPDPMRFYGSMAVVIGQLVLTFPAVRLWASLKAYLPSRGGTHPFDELTAHSGLAGAY
jgi:hypothetical protein